MEEEKKVREILEAPLKEKGFDLCSVSYHQSKEGPKLEVVVDRVDPIGLDDIVALSESISSLLDASDPIEGAYTLDVSSLGAEKPIALEKLPLYLGKYVALHLSHPYQGENNLEGTLESVDGESVSLSYSQKGRRKVASFPRADVDKARLAIKF